MKKLKDILMRKIGEASSTLCDSLQVITKNDNKEEVVAMIPVIPNMDGGIVASLHKEEYSKLLIYHEWDVASEEIRHVKYGNICQHHSCIHIQPPKETVMEESKIENLKCTDIAFYDAGALLKDHLAEIIVSCSKVGGWAGVYLRSVRTTELLHSLYIPTEDMTPDAAYEYKVKLDEVLEKYGLFRILCQRVLIRDFGVTRTGFMELFIDDDPVTIPSEKAQPEVKPPVGDRYDLIRILLKELGKENALDACDKVTIIFKDQEDKLIDCADITF